MVPTPILWISNPFYRQQVLVLLGTVLYIFGPCLYLIECVEHGRPQVNIYWMTPWGLSQLPPLCYKWLLRGVETEHPGTRRHCSQQSSYHLSPFTGTCPGFPQRAAHPINSLFYVSAALMCLAVGWLGREGHTGNFQLPFVQTVMVFSHSAHPDTFFCQL